MEDHQVDGLMTELERMRGLQQQTLKQVASIGSVVGWVGGVVVVALAAIAWQLFQLNS